MGRLTVVVATAHGVSRNVNTLTLTHCNFISRVPLTYFTFLLLYGVVLFPLHKFHLLRSSQEKKIGFLGYGRC
ncbi:hypothetical protein RIF29_19391 [Crotalaria pallida]|uniref:Uncharacterized protein n=1 Tax=Crotalaria pallida TaxID=3830 RepID=A0AAN9I6G7_CROPI